MDSPRRPFPCIGLEGQSDWCCSSRKNGEIFASFFVSHKLNSLRPPLVKMELGQTVKKFLPFQTDVSVSNSREKRVCVSTIRYKDPKFKRGRFRLQFPAKKKKERKKKLWILRFPLLVQPCSFPPTPNLLSWLINPVNFFAQNFTFGNCMCALFLTCEICMHGAGLEEGDEV